MRLIFGLLLREEVLEIQKRCDLYTGAANTRVYTVILINVFKIIKNPSINVLLLEV